MTFEYKVYLCCILMFIPSLIDCNRHVRDKVFYDINGQMFLLMTKNENTGNEQYNYLLAQDTVTVSMTNNIRFISGMDSLYRYLDSVYNGYFRNNEIEFNAIVFMHILFDENLNIVDEKNMSGNRKDDSMKGIDSLFRAAIMDTQGKWHFYPSKNEESDNYLVVLPYKIY